MRIHKYVVVENIALAPVNRDLAVQALHAAGTQSSNWPPSINTYRLSLTLQGITPKGFEGALFESEWYVQELAPETGLDLMARIISGDGNRGSAYQTVFSTLSYEFITSEYGQSWIVKASLVDQFQVIVFDDVANVRTYIKANNNEWNPALP